MKKDVIGIVGAGIAGCRLAWLLASESRKVYLFDHQAPWEKPCGGGLTFKIFREFSDLNRDTMEGENHRKLEMVFPWGRRVRLSLYHGIFTISREELGKSLLDRAVGAGADFRREKVITVHQSGEGFIIETVAGTYQVDFLIGADGVRSIVRQTLSRPLDREDMILAYYSLVSSPPGMPLIIRFFHDFPGYAWIFPRPGRASVGIALEGSSRERSIKLLVEFVNAEFVNFGSSPPKMDSITACLIPNLKAESLQEQNVAGKNWALAGDAAGAADPVTGEGIYYAFKSAHIIHRALQGRNLEEYGKSFKRTIGTELAQVSPLREKFYSDKRLRALGVLLDYSPSVRKLARKLVSGSQNYVSLKSRVKEEIPTYIKELLLSFLLFQKGERNKKSGR